MPEIQQLPPHIADLIAAGEVVERPASVVKELVENAIDAGAPAMVVEIQRGGMALIRVTDNGCGIAPGELPTAFLRHATSKLRKAEDLSAIGTLGFRGEALAAISAVSRVDILSRQRGAADGAALHLEGGVPGVTEPAGCPEGTTLVVRDLFYNTPARLKFMKSDSAEASAVAAMLQQIALSHPEVSIQYIRDGRLEMHTPGGGKLLPAIYAVRGRDVARSLVAVDGSGEGVTVRGFVTEPLAGRGTRAMQTFFCCGRMIRSQLLTAAVEEAYANRQMTGKFPGCVLHIDLPLQQVDVNVHPAKTVVKFAEERAVFSAVHHVVKDALDARAEPPVKAAPVNPEGGFFQKMDAKTFREKAEKEEKASKPYRQADPDRKKILIFHDADRPVPARAPAADSEQPVTEELQPDPFPPENPPAPEQTVLPSAPAPWKYRGELLHTYIVAEDGSDIWLIDKHAAHERINFDRLKANAEPVMRQQLLRAAAVDLPQEQYAALLENLPLLDEFGFTAEDFGDGCLMIRAIPSDIDTGQIRETLEMLADKLLSGAAADPNAARDAMLHTMACKSAIKGGWTSDPAELRVLIDKVQSGEVAYCPHGRPVKVKISKYELEK
ncbi:MAG: DNA mismatch repair endonuclease MutL, partial [Oscillospiraceae bacterium]|nr:DNA mismatch repair endonuclease MutL [Oscillospiraceae bacterium]